MDEISPPLRNAPCNRVAEQTDCRGTGLPASSKRSRQLVVSRHYKKIRAATTGNFLLAMPRVVLLARGEAKRLASRSLLLLRIPPESQVAVMFNPARTGGGRRRAHTSKCLVWLLIAITAITFLVASPLLLISTVDAATAGNHSPHADGSAPADMPDDQDTCTAAPSETISGRHNHAGTFDMPLGVTAAGLTGRMALHHRSAMAAPVEVIPRATHFLPDGERGPPVIVLLGFLAAAILPGSSPQERTKVRGQKSE
jgi:hypothetical protein